MPSSYRHNRKVGSINLQNFRPSLAEVQQDILYFFLLFLPSFPKKKGVQNGRRFHDKLLLLSSTKKHISVAQVQMAKGDANSGEPGENKCFSNNSSIIDVACAGVFIIN